MLNIIGWIVIGLITGILSRFFYPGEVPMNWFWTILLGIGGSLVGGFIGGLLTRQRDMLKPSPAGFIMSIVGGMVLIFIAHRFGIR